MFFFFKQKTAYEMRISDWSFRRVLFRSLLALLVGGVLGLGGAAMQGYLRNPLAEPSVLGASNMAALGAVIAFYFGLALIHPLLLPLMAVAGAIIALAPLMLLARRAESPLGLILAGIAISTLADRKSTRLNSSH